MKNVKFKIPKKPAEMADLLFKTREARYKLQRQAAAMDKNESLIEEALMKQLPKFKASGISGRIALVQLSEGSRPEVKDWPQFYNYIKKQNAFELLGKSIKKEAIEERLEAGEKIPGVGTFKFKKVSLTRI